MKTVKKNAVFRISGRIDDSLPEKLSLKDFFICKSKAPEYLFIPMRSAGGYLYGASKTVELLNVLKERGTKIVTINCDFVSSSALPIFATGDLRISKKIDNKFFFHRAELESPESATLEELASGEKSSFELMSDRFGLSINSIYDLANTSRRLNASEAMSLGIVHKIF